MTKMLSPVGDPSIYCDSAGCSYRAEVAESEIVEYIDKPCPQCGKSLISKKDYENFISSRAIIDEINSLEDGDPRILELLSKLGITEKLAEELDDSNSVRNIVSLGSVNGTMTAKSVRDEK